MNITAKIPPTLKPIIINAAVFGVLGVMFFAFARKNFYVFCFYEYCFKQLTLLINYLVENFLNLFSCFNIEIFGKIISDANGGSLILDRGCVGRNVMLTFVGFIIIWPEKFIKRILFIIVGICAIILFNVLRISGLMFTLKFFPDWFDFTHNYLFKYSLYLAVFGLWVVWFKTIGKNKNQLT